MKEKIIIYQVLPRIFGNKNCTNKINGTISENGCGKISDFNDKSLKSIKKMGCNYIWYTGLLQHASKTNYEEFGLAAQNPYVVKGEAGSPYAICDYYSVSPDLVNNVVARMDEFSDLITRTHKNGLKMIIDFVPNHVARQYHSNIFPQEADNLGGLDDTNVAFSPQNNFYYIPGQGFAPHIDLGSGDQQYVEYPAKATGNDCFHAYPGVNDWYETVKLNYGVDYSTGGRYFEPTPDTWNKMYDILFYWADKGIDGFRCDMAHMVPVEFWQWAITKIKGYFPDIIFIAEIYSPEMYRDFIFRAGFDYLYDKVGLYDLLKDVVRGDMPASAITRQWQELEGIQQYMLNFLENHDEQRFASDFFAGDAKKGRAPMVISAAMNTNPFMIYFGQELGERAMDQEGFSGIDGRTTIFDYWCVDKMKRWNNDGKWNEDKLNDNEKELRCFYSKLLNICNNEKAVREGAFFDLMYINYDNKDFDSNKVYSFIRKQDDDIILVAANFSDKELVTKIVIPEHAFDFLKIPEGEYCAVELLNNESTTLSLAKNKAVDVVIEPYGAIMMKMIIQKVGTKRKK